MRKILVGSHRRSGTHLLMESLKLNFPGVWPQKTHQKTSTDIYIYRDLEEVLVSCYYWWMGSGESQVSQVMEDFLPVGLSGYIRGKAKVNGVEHPKGLKAWEFTIFDDPIKFWQAHVAQGWKNSKVTVSYESLVSRPIETLETIGEALSLGLPKGLTVNSLVGHHPTGKGRKAQEILSQEDKDYIKGKL